MDKIVANIAEALAGAGDGATVLVGGFGRVGCPDTLLAGLAESGVKGLTVVANNVGGDPEMGILRLMMQGQISKMICSFPRSGRGEIFGALLQAGKLELEVVPQGTLAERIRAAGAGIGGFFTPTSAGTILADGKETRELNGVPQVFELPIYGDIALVQAWQADPYGNLIYRGTGRNFNPIMAAAAKLTIVETINLAAVGDLDPERIITPGIYVNRVVHAPRILQRAAA